MSKKTPTTDEIAEAAFHLWLKEGKPHGSDQDHWHRARAALETKPPARKRAAPKPKATAAKAKTAAAKSKTTTTKPRVAKPRKPKA